jgi:hypothetical protein
MAAPKKTVHQAPRVANTPPQTALSAALRAFGSTSKGAKQRANGRGPARAVGSFVPKLTQTAFEKFGFSTAALLTDWPTIVGPKLAQYTVPDRIKWPRGVEHHDGELTNGPTTSGPRRGATLCILVEPARALDVQYQGALIIDRINSYFGYRAIAELRLQQECVAHVPDLAPPIRKPVPLLPPDPVLSAIPDDSLRAALQRLEASVMSRSR